MVMKATAVISGPPAVRLIVATILAWVASATTTGAVEFCGYATVGDKIRFVVTEPESGDTSSWILLGETFRGYTLVAFDAKADTLTVRSTSALLKLPLKPSRVVPQKVVVYDSVGALDVSKIPEMRVEKLGSRRIPITNPNEIALIVQILKNAKVVSLRGAPRQGVTHLLWMPNLWMYQAGTGCIGMVSKQQQLQPLYQVREEDKELFEQLLAAPKVLPRVH
jgi:hypothetical protein